MSFIKKSLIFLIISGLLLSLVGLLAGYFYYLSLEKKLPDVENLKHIQLNEPLRVYSQDQKLIAEYGVKRRIPIAIEDTPEQLKNAFIAAEDDRFYEHPGVDWQGIVRAGYVWAKTGKRAQGGSTITMQLARNFFLSNDKKISRKINEILLALKMSKELTKDEVLQLYLNKIYLGKRAYGVAAAAKTYYNKNVNELTLAQICMIAGLPKAPSKFNPIARPERAKIRRNYVLKRMLELDMISQAEHDLAKATPLTAKTYKPEPEIDALYIGEMVRSELEKKFPESVYDSGFKVYTTIDSAQQTAANQAARRGLMRIDQRHGYRGIISSHNNLFAQDEFNQKHADQLIDETTRHMNLIPAIVFDLNKDTVRLYLGAGETTDISFDSMRWAKKYINEDSQGPKLKKPSDILAKGDLIWLDKNQQGQFSLAQIPAQEVAMVALRPESGAITALIGGKDYFLSKFNRATQARRQAGSSFKPFLYSAAINDRFNAASVINDAPVVFGKNAFAGKWKPKNYSSKSYGPTRLRTALTYSRNLVSIRLLMAMGVAPVRNFAISLGFDQERLPNDLSLALGSGTVSPIELASKFALFANGGYEIKPYLIDRVENSQGEIVYQAPRSVTCQSCWLKEHPAAQNNSDLQLAQANRVMPEETAFIMRSILADVTRIGTGRKARALKRTDIGGKTGTTNDQVDAWFNGFSSDLVATVWVGHDDSKPLGARETGTSAASPIWVEFMQTALKNSPNKPPKPPKNIVQLKVDPLTGLLAYEGQSNAISEYFNKDNAPRERATPPSQRAGSGLEATTPENHDSSQPISEPLF